MEDLTNLSGPELAGRLRDLWPWPDTIVRIVCERLEENDRVAMRNLERERDGLRAQCESWKRKALATHAQIDRDDSIAQGMSTAELVAEVRRARETRGCLIGEVQQLKAIVANQRKELHSLNKERKATLTELEEAQRELARLTVHADTSAKRIADLEARVASLCDAGQYACESPPAGCECPGCSFSREASAELEHSKVAPARDVVSTAELTPFEIAAANACDAMHVDADGLGFVKREWLDRHRANVQKQRQVMDEPAIDADEPITSWSVGKVLHALDRHVSAEALDVMAAKYLRELLTKLDAVTGLAQRWESCGAFTVVRAHDAAKELREVLNVKQ